MAAKNIIVNLPGNTITEDGYAVGKSSIILKIVCDEELSTEYEDGEISSVDSNSYRMSAFNSITGEQYIITVSNENADDGSRIISFGVSN